MTTASAPGKIILFGEHAVVYGRPAIAVPVAGLVATATVTEQPGCGCRIMAHDLGRSYSLSEAQADDPLALVVRLALREIEGPTDPDWCIGVRSTIPMASGLGSGAAVGTALARAILYHAGRDPDPELISRIVYESEKIHHGTPSGIDNTVVAFERPIWFVGNMSGEQRWKAGDTGQQEAMPPYAAFQTVSPFTIAIADTGIASPTRETVRDVRLAWQNEPDKYDSLFDQIGAITDEARAAIEAGRIELLGPLMRRNQAVLRELGVSCRRIEELITAAQDAGSPGAKLSGGGRGGNVIALVSDADQAIVQSLVNAGAVRVVTTQVGSS